MRQGIEILINYLFYERYTEIYSWKVVNFGNFCVFFGLYRSSKDASRIY